MENSYGVGVMNRCALFLDDESDPLDALKAREQAKDLKKKTNEAEKENKGKPETKPKNGIAPARKGMKETQNVKSQENRSSLDYGGSNAEVMKASWEFKVGTTMGIKAADDLWVGRYLLSRIAEHFGVIVRFHPKPMGKNQPGIGCHHNFRINKMRSEGGIKEIERICKIPCERHEQDIKNYGLGDGEENKKRLTGKFETASFEKCEWGVDDRSASLRLQRSVKTLGKGFLEDRRPAGDCDPYRVCAVLAETCT
ncbi:hypothetical protein K1T71_004153 [Dendrolimus kikuchii]|uniref:Uncharacterized protein n=1 Tax=Dendrolimus kikuchii TaxID=765133 RepID=A0ACC1DA03_9NEOP|nr:hypothetical protein K1T71_004153 [Dendrolimus kikuchii]